MTDRTHDRNRLLYWKKIIREAEAYNGTNIDWMRKHGIMAVMARTTRRTNRKVETL